MASSSLLEVSDAIAALINVMPAVRVARSLGAERWLMFVMTSSVHLAEARCKVRALYITDLRTGHWGR